MEPTTRHGGVKRSRLTEPVDLVQLSVSGVPFVAERATLRAVPGSMLAAMFDADTAFAAPSTNEEGATIINRDADAFGFILGWLRRGSLAGRPRPEVLRALVEDADYFGLDTLVEHAEKLQKEEVEELMVIAPKATRENTMRCYDDAVDAAVADLNKKYKEGWRFKDELRDKELPLPYNGGHVVKVKYYTMRRQRAEPVDA
jgi:hypothetical protein